MPKPTLPSLDEAWLSAIFGGGQSGSDAGSQEIPCMERLAFVGETALQLGVMAWVTQRYPKYKKRADLKEKQKSLATVKKAASWGQLYTLSGKLSRFITMQPGFIKPSNSELFFAYLGALVESKGRAAGGVETAVKWIGDILQFEEDEGPADPASDVEEEDEVEEELIRNPASSRLDGSSRIIAALSSPPKYSSISRTTPPPPSVSIPSPPGSPQGNSINALSQVNERLSQQGVLLKWEETAFGADHKRTWNVKTVYDGKEYAGLGATKKLAKAHAAEQILQTLTAQSGKRRQF